MSAIRSKPVDAALTIGALLGLTCIVAALSAVLFGLTPLVFRSDSMAPAIPTGSLAIGKDVPASDIRAGDVISVERADGSRITHRVESVDSLVGNSATLTLKGDANSVVDAEPYTVTSAVEVIAHAPYAGYFVAWLSTPFAWFVGALLSGALIWVAFRPAARDPETTSTSTGPRHAKHGKASRSAVTSVLVVAVTAGVVGVGFSRTDMTEAAITDTAYGSASLVAGNLPQPTSFTCETTRILTIQTARLSWVSNLTYSHRIVYSRPGASYTPPDYDPGVTSATVPRGSFLGLGTQWTASLYAVRNGFISAVPLTRTVTVNLSVIGIVLSSQCGTEGTTTSSSGARAARLAAPTEEATTAVAPSTPSTSTSSPTPSTTSATPSTTTTSPTSTTGAATPTTTTTSPTTTTPTTTTTTTTPPPPPPTAFIADGGSASSGNFTASIASNRLAITGTDGATVFEGPVTSSPRYGTGAVWSTDGNLYLLSEGRDPMRVGPSADGPFVSTAVPTSQLPADIAALL